MNLRVRLAAPGNLGILEFGRFGIGLKKPSQVKTGKQFQGLRLKLKTVILTFGYLDHHLCQQIMRVVGWGI